MTADTQRRGKRGYLSLEGVDITHIHREWQLTNTLWSALQRLFSVIVVILCLPLFLILYLPVRITTGGSLFYTQTRPGFLGRDFRILKIRSMKIGSDKDKSRQKGVAKDDPNVSRLGRFLRDTKIDELPQFINVLMGDMELVGPRPIAPELNKLLCAHIPGFNRRYLVKPGLTNIGQVSILENALGEKTIEDWRQRFEGEEHYIQNKSISYDLILIAMTIVFMLRKGWRRMFGRSEEEPTPAE